MHVPLREPADRSYAEGQFGIVERGLEPEGGYGEVAIPTYPASAFVAAGGIALLLDHVTEYEVAGDELALTVLRSTGLISRIHHPWREDPAGPCATDSCCANARAAELRVRVPAERRGACSSRPSAIAIRS